MEQIPLFQEDSTRRVIFFNGPPRSGKDTICDLLASKRRLARLKFADPLKDQCCALLGIDRAELERIKDFPHPVFNGGTPRQYLINLSEKLIKPIYGDQFFGKASVHKIEYNNIRGLIAFSDSGFKSEAVPVVKLVGLQRCVKINIMRKGTSFENDSRSYWHMDGLQEFDGYNEGTPEEFLNWTLQILKLFKF